MDSSRAELETRIAALEAANAELRAILARLVEGEEAGTYHVSGVQYRRGRGWCKQSEWVCCSCGEVIRRYDKLDELGDHLDDCPVAEARLLLRPLPPMPLYEP